MLSEFVDRESFIYACFLLSLILPGNLIHKYPSIHFATNSTATSNVFYKPLAVSSWVTEESSASIRPKWKYNKSYTRPQFLIPDWEFHLARSWNHYRTRQSEEIAQTMVPSNLCRVYSLDLHQCNGLRVYVYGPRISDKRFIKRQFWVTMATIILVSNLKYTTF